ncbi:hydroxymethylbilane synthase [Lutibacter sp.]|uniref:hydroxymethylbilane synthase n=1 Tax=Lutibacter sp. TaxID=1925666 RepID=UPI003568C927
MKMIRIGTRASQLALWQANLVKTQLENLGYQTQIIEVSSTGDEVLDKPLHQIGGFGLFTKTLDNAMLRGEIDVAVHSLKDVPTDLPEKITQAAILERANISDVLILKNNADFLNNPENAIIATGSLRRRAQWLHKYPNHTITELRGNVNTRLQKLIDNDWNGAIFAAAGLERIELLPENHVMLDWMIPAAAQGAIMITALKADTKTLDICAQINHKDTEIAVTVERQFMKTLEGGCTAPIGGNAKITGDTIYFKGILIAIDGSEKVEVEKALPISEWKSLGKICAEEVLNNGGKKLMESIKAEMKK